MFYPKLPSDWLHVNLEGAPPGFCFVELKSSTDALSPNEAPLHEELKALCCNDSVNSTKFRQKVFEVFEKAVAGKRRARGKNG